MATPVTAISPSGRWLATCEASNRVSIRDSNTGRLQCTIRCPSHERVGWITDSTVAADTSLLDVTRGITTGTLESHTAVMDIATTGSCLYILEAKHGTNKLVVYEYTSEHKLVRKLKVGKTQEADEAVQLFATPSYLVVGTKNSSWRVVDRSSGSKVCKIGQGCHLGATAGSWACGSTTPHIVTFWNLVSGSMGGTVTVTDAKDLQLWAVNATEYQLLVGNQQLFRIDVVENDDGEAKITSELISTIPEPTKGDKDNVQFVLHKGLRAVRYTDDLECLSQLVDTTQNPISISWTNNSSADSTATESLKRKQTVILGAGQSGHEAKSLTEASSKRSRTESEIDDEDSPTTADQTDEMEVDDGPTIADRLAQLQKTLEEEEAREHADANTPSDSTNAKLTTESLYQLLHQALQSADKQQLEQALQTRDPNTVAASCRELDAESVAALLVALTHRLATKPTRADHLSVWLTAVLNNPNVSAEHLLPLQNLLQERLEIFPMLLELEGRLDQLVES